MQKAKNRWLIIVPFLSVWCIFLFLWWIYHPSSSNNTNNKLQEIDIVKKENRLLETELKAASNPTTYIVLDLGKGKIYLKIRGFILKEFNILKLEILGKQYLNDSYHLVAKKEKYPPKRIEIKPPNHKNGESTSTAQTTASSQALDTFDLEDMPSDYTMLFNNGLSISITSKLEDSFFQTTLSYIHNGLKHIYNLFNLIVNYFRKRPFLKIDIVMNRDDARVLYWSLPEDADFIVTA